MNPKALAFCTTALGDTVLCTPAIRALGKAYDLDVVVHQKRRPLLENNPYIKGLYSYRNNDLNRLFLALMLWRKKYHRIVVLHANSDVKKLIRLLRYEKALNIQGWQDNPKNTEAFIPDSNLHVIDKRLFLTQKAGAISEKSPMRVYLEQSELTKGKDWLKENKLADKPVVALCCGAAQIYKMWPAEGFGFVAKKLSQNGYHVLIVGSKPEAQLAEKVNQASGNICHMALGLDLRLCASVLASCKLLITNDTGPMHLAQAVGATVLALFGPTDHETIGPVSEGSCVLSVQRTCDPCLTKACKDPFCMSQLDEQKVLEKAKDMLETAKVRL